MAGRKEGYIEKRGPNKWLIQIDLGTVNQDGKPKRKRESWTFTGTKSEANKDLRRRLDELGRGVDKDGQAKSLTLEQYITYYLDHVVKQKVRDRTYADYKAAAARYIFPDLGPTSIKVLTLNDVQTFYTRLGEKGRNARKKGLSARTIRYVHHILSAAMKRAVREDLITRNPAAFADLPKSKVAKKRVVVGDVESAQRFREAAIRCWRAAVDASCGIADCSSPPLARGLCERHYQAARRAGSLPKSPVASEWGLLLLVDLVSGMRPGELQGLQWADIDWRSGVLRLTRAVEWVARSWKFVELKTERSRRSITLPPSLLALLKEHRRHQLEHRLRLGEAYENHDLVFAGPTGTPFDRPTVNRHHLPKILEAAGLPKGMTMYALRHSMATVLLAMNENVKIVSERLGHASVLLTLDTYQHVTATMQADTASKLESMVFGEEEVNQERKTV